MPQQPDGTLTTRDRRLITKVGQRHALYESTTTTTLPEQPARVVTLKVQRLRKIIDVEMVTDDESGAKAKVLRTDPVLRRRLSKTGFGRKRRFSPILAQSSSKAAKHTRSGMASKGGGRTRRTANDN